MTAADLAPMARDANPGCRSPLGIVVVAFGSPDLLARNLANTELPSGEIHVVVVDNFSTAQNRRDVARLCAARGWHLVEMPGNPGFGAGMNAGIAAARELGCRSFLLLNPDAVVSRAVIEELWAHSEREPLSLISPRLADSDGRIVFRGSRLDLRDGGLGAVRTPELGARAPVEDWLTAACLIVHDRLLERIGGFAEDYFLYWEDVDLSHRALGAGASLVVRHDLVAVHDEGGTHQAAGSRAAHSPLYYRWNCRNRLVFAARHLDRRTLLGWMLRTPSASWQILLRGGRRQLLESPRPLWAAVSGSVAGLVLALQGLILGPRPASLPGRRPAILVVHPGAELYGSDRMLLETVRALLDRGPVLVALPGPGPLVAELERHGASIVVCRMPVLRKSMLSPLGMLRLARDAALGLVPAIRLLRRCGGGVHVNTTIAPSWLLLGRLARRRVVCHVHEAQWPGPRMLHRLLLSALLAASTVVANSDHTRRVLAQLQPALAARTTVVPNGVPGPDAPVPPRARLDGAVRLLFVGRLSPRKGPDVAIASLRELLDRGVEARLTVAGAVFDGYEWFESRLRDMASDLGVAERVDFVGFRPDVWPVLAGADVVLVPSVLDESFGNSAVEAVLAARPVVVSDLGGLREATAGYLCAEVAPPGRPELWADAVERIVRQWDQMAAAAPLDAGRARARHAPDRYRQRLADVVAPLPVASSPVERHRRPA